MKLLASLIGFLLLAVVLIDGFNTIVLPRQTQHGFRVTRAFYRLTYTPYAAIARRISSGRWREAYLSVYGPLSLLALIGVWAIGIVLGFGLLEWAAGVQWNGHPASLFDAVYLSSNTLETLGTGNPTNAPLKLLTMAEGLLGLTFLGLTIGYLPTLYQSFSRREVQIALLDGRAGSPPSATGLIECEGANPARLEKQLAQWEEWAAELMENHLSYPMLAYFRSHHESQSWVTAIVAVVDAAAITVACSHGDLKTQAGLTFALGRQALADIDAVFKISKAAEEKDRLPRDQFAHMRDRLARGNVALHMDRLSEPELKRLREMYEPCAERLSRHFMMALPPWIASDAENDWSAAGQSDPPADFTVSDPYNES